jgi:hypothetical protein
MITTIEKMTEENVNAEVGANPAYYKTFKIPGYTSNPDVLKTLFFNIIRRTTNYFTTGDYDYVDVGYLSAAAGTPGFGSIFKAVAGRDPKRAFIRGYLKTNRSEPAQPLFAYLASDGFVVLSSPLADEMFAKLAEAVGLEPSSKGGARHSRRHHRKHRSTRRKQSKRRSSRRHH